MDKKKILAALPDQARRKLQRFNRICERAEAEGDGLWNKIHDLRGELNHQITMRRQVQFKAAPAFQHLAEIETDREKEIKAEIQELELAINDAKKVAMPYRDVTGRSFSWIESVISAGGKIAAVPAPTLGSDKDLLAQVSTVREKINSTKEQIERLEQAPVPAAELKKLAADQIKRLSHHGEPAVLGGTRNGDPILFPSVMSEKFLAWALNESLMSRVNELIDAEPLEGAVGTAEREKKLTKLSAEQLSLERQEEAMIEAAEKNQIVIERRPDSDVRAVLAIVDQ